MVLAPSGISGFTVDGNAYTAPVTVPDGQHTIIAPSTATIGSSNYTFQHWEDGSTNPTRTITTSANTTVTATYQIVIPTHTLVVVSSPLTGIPVTVDSISYVTNTSPITLVEGSHTIVTPLLIISCPSTYAFASWEDGSVSASRTLSLTADKTVTATYVKVVPVLTLLVSPAGAGTTSATPSPPYDKDEVVVITATVSDPVNFRFRNG